ncbi:cell envelope integrity protein TolA [Aurantimicrobium minutum]|uniref:cell envelope integrity protein TolA n=1 Tax=Aurantimicrobium minutum TaxID=708131 RepID=UPI002474B496|nr:cell envelope integrity protein TolA [Aurantimicrobium minutum]MDH6422694.1 chemotaxis protein histidine kinase CheA [Aurantimicrobium minutum]
MSGDIPDIVLNEFGDLSRKARRELEARGIDPDTAVVEYIAATGQMPIITPEAAAAAKAQAQAEAAAAHYDESPEPERFHEESTVVVSEPIDLPAVEPVIAPPTSSVPPVSVPVTAAETGPIEPLTVSPILSSVSLSAVEETLAQVSDQTGEILTTGFDSLVTVETSDIPAGPSKGEVRRLARKEKKAQALAAKAEKQAATQQAKAEAAQLKQEAAEILSRKADQRAAREEEKTAQEREAQARSVAEVEALRIRQEQEEAARVEAEQAAEKARLEAEERAAAEEQSQEVESTSHEQPQEVEELDTIDDDEYDEEEFEPQTISEATAAIAIAEAVAAAEAVVEAGEVSIEYGNLANSTPATTGSISVISNALILPTLPETTGSIAPINPTGEIVITGSILIPSAVSQVGATLENLDTSEIDVIKDDEEVAPTQGMAPVSAATAVSAYNISNNVVTTPRGMNERLPFILSITAAGLAVGVVALFVAGYFLGLF